MSVRSPKEPWFSFALRQATGPALDQQDSSWVPGKNPVNPVILFAAHKAACLAGESPVAGIDCLPA